MDVRFPGKTGHSGCAGSWNAPQRCNSLSMLLVQRFRRSGAKSEKSKTSKKMEVAMSRLSLDPTGVALFVVAVVAALIATGAPG